MANLNVDTMQLETVISAIDGAGLSASDVFAAMIEELADDDALADEDDEIAALIAVLVDFAAPPPRPRKKQPAEPRPFASPQELRGTHRLQFSVLAS